MDGAVPVGVAELAAGRGITRLCHLTPFRNLVHLAADGVGLLSLRQLAETAGDFDRQDLERLDGHPDHICCSIQYPNGWYLRRRKLGATPVQRLFPDWVCLAIDPRHLWGAGTRVCVRNAAAAGGSLIQGISTEAFEALYRSPISGAYGRLYSRGPHRLRASPTDDQAEVLVHRMIPLTDVRTVLVASESDAKRFHAALAQIGADVDGLRWAIAPTLFDAQALRVAIAGGKTPIEILWLPQ